MYRLIFNIPRFKNFFLYLSGVFLQERNTMVKRALYWAANTLLVDRICGVWLSLCVCVCVCSRLASVCLRLRASASVCVGRLVSRLASVCVCSGQGFRMRASASCASRVCLASASRVCASASVSRLSRVCLASICLASVCVCVCLTSRVPNARVCLRLSVLVNACGNWLILCVGRHSKSLKGFCYRHTIL